MSDSSGKDVRIQHAPGSHLVPRNQGLPRAGGFAFYGHSCYLTVIRADVTDAAQATVVDRVVYPGPVQSIMASEGRLPVTVNVLVGEGEAASRRYSYPPSPDQPQPTVYPLDEEAFAAPMADALRLVPGLRRDGSLAEDEREGAKGRLRLLEAAFAANPTNPWYKFCQGAVLRGDDKEAARAAFRAAVDARGAPAFDYLRMSALLAAMGEMAESDVAFERGYAEFVGRGLEPELLMSRGALERVYAFPLDGADGGSGERAADGPATAHALAMAKASEAGDTETMLSLAERVWRLAPRCEGVTFAFAGVAEHLQGEGRKSEADVWLERAESASRFAGPVGSRHVFYAGVSCLGALVLLLIICFAKARPRQRKDLAPLGGWFASWRWTWERFGKMAFAYASRKELVGIFLVAAAGFTLSYAAIRAERSVFRSAKLPEELKTGTWAQPGAAPYLERLRDELRRPANRLLFGIALQQETQGRAGRDAYDDVGGDAGVEAVAANNAGVALWESADAVRAGVLFKKARELDPALAEARYNDDDREAGGGRVGSARTSRARRYLRGRKIVALPDADMLAEAFAGTEAPGEAAARAGGLGSLKLLAWLTVVVTAIAGILVLPFLVIRRPAAPGRKWGAVAGLGYVFPGTSARLAPTGGLILAAWAYCLVVVVLVVRGEAGGDVDALSRMVKGTFGITGSIVFWFESVMMIFGPAAFVGLWVLNGVLLARATRMERATARAAAPPPEPGAAAGVEPAAAPAEAAEEPQQAEQEEGQEEETRAEEPGEAREEDRDEDREKDREEDREEERDEAPEEVEEVVEPPAVEEPARAEEPAAPPPPADKSAVPAPPPPEAKKERPEPKAEPKPEPKAEPKKAPPGPAEVAKPPEASPAPEAKASGEKPRPKTPPPAPPAAAKPPEAGPAAKPEPERKPPEPPASPKPPAGPPSSGRAGGGAEPPGDASPEADEEVDEVDEEDEDDQPPL